MSSLECVVMCKIFEKFILFNPSQAQHSQYGFEQNVPGISIEKVMVFGGCVYSDVNAMSILYLTQYISIFIDSCYIG